MEGLERGGKPNPDVTINSGVGVQRTDDEAQGLKKNLEPDHWQENPRC